MTALQSVLFLNSTAHFSCRYWLRSDILRHPKWSLIRLVIMNKSLRPRRVSH